MADCLLKLNVMNMMISDVSEVNTLSLMHEIVSSKPGKPFFSDVFFSGYVVSKYNLDIIDNGVRKLREETWTLYI